MKTNGLGKFLVLIATISRFVASGQGFLNLDFEQTSLPPNGPPGTVSTTSGLPGWEVSIGGVPQSTILYNNATLGDSSVAILGKGNSVNAVIDGNFSVALTGGAYPGDSSIPADAAISQTGLVPSNARSILFASYSRGNGFPNLSLTLNGQSVDLTLVSTSSNYSLYGADVSPFAGKSANLTIAAPSNYPLGFGVFGLDDISFSPNTIPEPSVLCLFVPDKTKWRTRPWPSRVPLTPWKTTAALCRGAASAR